MMVSKPSRILLCLNKIINLKPSFKTVKVYTFEKLSNRHFFAK